MPMRILLCGDTTGVTQLLDYVPSNNIIGIIAATIRPQYINSLETLSEKNKIPLLVQPKWKTERYEEFLRKIIQAKPDLILVNSYSMIIREDVLSASRLGGINVHGALLPRNRGCNPTQWAILNQEYETGVTLHQMDSGIDTGPIIDQQKIPISFHNSWLDVKKREVEATNDLLKSNVPGILLGNWKAIPQIKENATTGRRRTPEDSEFFWSEKIIDIHNKIRALLPPLPCAFYRNQNDESTKLSQYQTPWELTVVKYGEKSKDEFIQSENIRLLPLQKKDSDLLSDWSLDPNSPLWNSNYGPDSGENQGTWVERMMTKRSDLIIFAIEEMEHSKPIGTCSFHNINWRNRSSEVQVRIKDSEYFSQSYEIEAVNLLCDFGFDDLNLHRVYLHIFADNNNALSAYEQIGFVEEGCHKEAAFSDGSWRDILYMSKIEKNE